MTFTADCPVGMTQDGCNCYQVIDSLLSFYSALLACQQLGAELMSLTTNDEVTFIQSYVESLGATGTQYWTDYTDQPHEGWYL